MVSTTGNVVYFGVKGTVLALDRGNGSELWRTPLKGSGFVNLVRDGNDLFATTKGEIFCLDPITGGIRWSNSLRGLGWGLVTVAATDASGVAAMAQLLIQQAQETSAVAAASASVAAGAG